MAIAMSKTREQYPLSSKKIIKKTISSLLGWFFAIIFLYAFGIALLVSAQFMDSFKNIHIVSLLSWMTIGTIIVLLVLLIPTYIYQKLYFESYFYDLTEDFIIFRKGVVTPHEITIPYERIQDVYVDQDLFDRFFNIYDVHLSTATYTSGIAAHIDGVEKPAADGLRSLLLQTITKKISRNTNIT